MDPWDIIQNISYCNYNQTNNTSGIFLYMMFTPPFTLFLLLLTCWSVRVPNFTLPGHFLSLPQAKCSRVLNNVSLTSANTMELALSVLSLGWSHLFLSQNFQLKVNTQSLCTNYLPGYFICIIESKKFFILWVHIFNVGLSGLVRRYALCVRFQSLESWLFYLRVALHIFLI